MATFTVVPILAMGWAMHMPFPVRRIMSLPMMCVQPEGPRPSLCVLDLDMCVWNKEMYTLVQMPGRPIIGDLNGRGLGVVGVCSGPDIIRLYPGALAALQEVADGKHGSMRLAVASAIAPASSEKIGRAAMEILEVLPGLTMKELLTRGGFEDGRNLQIGRQPPLSASKGESHFPILRQLTGIPYDEMLFFDDCRWNDQCGDVETHCEGVVTQRTPRGLQLVEWHGALRKFAATRPAAAVDAVTAAGSEDAVRAPADNSDKAPSSPQAAPATLVEMAQSEQSKPQADAAHAIEKDAKRATKRRAPSAKRRLGARARAAKTAALMREGEAVIARRAEIAATLEAMASERRRAREAETALGPQVEEEEEVLEEVQEVEEGWEDSQAEMPGEAADVGQVDDEAKMQARPMTRTHAGTKVQAEEEMRVVEEARAASLAQVVAEAIAEARAAKAALAAHEALIAEQMRAAELVQAEHDARLAEEERVAREARAVHEALVAEEAAQEAPHEAQGPKKARKKRKHRSDDDETIARKVQAALPLELTSNEVEEEA